ncbi:beta-1,3-galactosyltransferase 5-like [Stegodyphus dumicola]|uniref:beta-1,3-galactosyltransferase 5-like n=1 Tax=Stegodyphus dumicola TaxID=202533 RepID=UPI0015AA1FAA|nr:beta-1,3-galactosyltransferase 5-like [Stegodyphus dumicola]
MKRYNRISSGSLCIIPKKAIAWIMLLMAVLTILFFISIEVRKILSLGSLTREKILKQNHGTFSTSNSEFSSSQYTSSEISAETEKGVIRSFNSVVALELFEEQPHCATKPFLLVLVASAPENFERRDAIRKAWVYSLTNKEWTSELKTKILFLVGFSPSKFLNILLKNENEQSGDILLGEYLDTYRNLTTKVKHGLTWALHHCQPTYLLKTDDDCFVNLPLLIDFLWKYNPVRKNLYAGRVRWYVPVIRDPNSRWYVSSIEYRRPRYAPYVNGAGYIFSLDVLKKFVAAADTVLPFPNEDAYVGTVLNVAGVRPTYSARFVTHAGPWQMCNFLYLFVVHHVKATRQWEFQEMAKRAMEECSSTDMAKDWV